MRNSFFAISNREYYLYDTTKTVFDRAYYRERLFFASLKLTHHVISIKEVETHVNNEEFMQKFKANLITDSEQWFWEHSTPELKRSLLFSFYLRLNGNKGKIPNVETENWLNVFYFKKMRERILEDTQIQHILYPPDYINALIKTTGKHRTNLRMGHIHLTHDVLKNREVYGIHWDASIVDLQDKKSILKHWVFDDMPS